MPVTGRLTSKDLVIQFLPHGVAETHVQHLYFQADIAGGTFKLRVNGELTAAITAAALVATMLTNINAALDALPNLAAGDIVATGTAITDITLTAIVDKWYTILVEDDLLTGNTGADPNVVSEVTAQGSALFTMTAELSQFSWEGSSEFTDVTPLNQAERVEISVANSVSFDMSMFKADTDWEIQVFNDQWGNLSVYPEGKIVGKQYFVFQAILEKVSESYPDHEKVEIEISGKRQNGWIVPPKSIYRV